MNKEIIKELLEKLKQCDDFHNRCDFLMEHSEITYMLDYITKLQEENKQLKDKLIEINEVINGYMPNQYAMCKAFDEIEFIISKEVE